AMTTATTVTPGASIEITLAVLEVQSEQANDQADSAILESARAAKREHDREQVDALRDKATHLLISGAVQGALLVGAGAAQAVSATNQYGADMDRAKTAARSGNASAGPPTLTAEGAADQRDANLAAAAAKGFDSGAKVTDLAMNAVTAGDD